MVFDLLRRQQKPIEQKASAAARVVAWHGSGRAAWSSRDSNSLIRSGFLSNPVGFRCVKLIAEAAAALPLVLQDQQQRFEQHPLLALLAQPNAAQGQAELLEALFGHLLLTGADGWPMGYDYKVGGRKHRFEMTGARPSICHIKSFHPQDDHYGVSPLQAAAMAVDVHNSASRWSKALLDNAARPSGALVWRGSEGQGTMSEDQFRRLSDEIEANFQGARNAGRPMVLEGGLDWKPMGFSPSDMEFQQTKEAAAREIALAFGVPPMLLGIQGDATYANYQEANRAFYRLTVVPLVTRVAAALVDWLTSFDGEQLTLKPDLDQVAALSAERDAQWSRVSSAAFLSRGEKRSLLGLPPESGGPEDA